MFFFPDFTAICFLTHGSTVAWRNTLEDWAAEDWTEDVSVGQAIYSHIYLFLYTVAFKVIAVRHLYPDPSLLVEMMHAAGSV